LLREGIAPGGRIVIGASANACASAPSAADKAIHDEIDFTAKPGRMYEILLDERFLTAFTREAAEIHREAGSALTLFEGRVKGETSSCKSDKRIVQAWRVETWPEGVYAIARFQLSAKDLGSRISFDLVVFHRSSGKLNSQGGQGFPGRS
jgi:activator of HSP90 ATPase